MAVGINVSASEASVNEASESGSRIARFAVFRLGRSCSRRRRCSGLDKVE